MSGGLRSRRLRETRAAVGLTVDVPRHEDRGPLDFDRSPDDFDVLSAVCLAWADGDPCLAFSAFIATMHALPDDVSRRLHRESIRRRLAEHDDDPGAPPF